MNETEITILLELHNRSSYREIAARIGKSLRAVQEGITFLEEKGYCQRSGVRKARSVTVTNLGLEVLKKWRLIH